MTRPSPLTIPDPTDTVHALRSVRNRIGHKVDLVDFLEPVAARVRLSGPRGALNAAWAGGQVIVMVRVWAAFLTMPLDAVILIL
jgi:hypothetical protein